MRHGLAIAGSLCWAGQPSRATPAACLQVVQWPSDTSSICSGLLWLCCGCCLQAGRCDGVEVHAAHLGSPFCLGCGGCLLAGGLQVVLLRLCHLQPTGQLPQLLPQLGCLTQVPSVARLSCQHLQSGSAAESAGHAPLTQGCNNAANSILCLQTCPKHLSHFANPAAPESAARFQVASRSSEDADVRWWLHNRRCACKRRSVAAAVC